ncbi:MAG TPA: YciI family protein [Acidobacteriota bacterium]|nr:YciI family protein [Acidobacteriota bacterium]
MKTLPSAPLYLLLLHQPHGSGPGPTPAQMREIMAQFAQWMDGIRAAGALVSSHGLQPKGKVLRGRRGQNISDGPYAETKEIVGGYVLIRAKNLSQATRIARGCPGLDHRLAVEVRPIKH